MAYQKRNERSDREDRGEFVSRRRPAIPANDKIDINDIEVLRHYVTEFGKIIPARVTGVTSMQQRQIKKGVRRARNMGLMA
ncbi:MAG: 30S ribosomal protein S18 [Kiritimatiellia bacterium]